LASNWSLNAVRYGLCNLWEHPFELREPTLCTTFADGFGLVEVITNVLNNTLQSVSILLPSAELPFYTFGTARTRFANHFPYGYVVKPVRPVRTSVTTRKAVGLWKWPDWE
jgi:hypothetical protein